MRRIGVVKLGMVEDASQVTAMKMTLRAGAVDYGWRKLTCQFKVTESPLSVCGVGREKRFGDERL